MPWMWGRISGSSGQVSNCSPIYKHSSMTKRAQLQLVTWHLEHSGISFSTQSCTLELIQGLILPVLVQGAWHGINNLHLTGKGHYLSCITFPMYKSKYLHDLEAEQDFCILILFPEAITTLQKRQNVIVL